MPLNKQTKMFKNEGAVDKQGTLCCIRVFVRDALLVVEESLCSSG